MTALEQMGQQAKIAARNLAFAEQGKNQALFAIAQALREQEANILAANEQDLQEAKNNGMNKAMLDRLTLNHDRIEGMAKGVEQIAGQKDPIGTIVEGGRLDNGLRIQQVRVPLGVIGIISVSYTHLDVYKRQGRIRVFTVMPIQAVRGKSIKSPISIPMDKEKARRNANFICSEARWVPQHSVQIPGNEFCLRWHSR